MKSITNQPIGILKKGDLPNLSPFFSLCPYSPASYCCCC